MLSLCLSLNSSHSFTVNPGRVLEPIGQGESNSLEFKEEQVRSESLAREMVAFANALSGVILIGLADDGVLASITDSAEMRLPQPGGNLFARLVAEYLESGENSLR